MQSVNEADVSSPEDAAAGADAASAAEASAPEAQSDPAAELEALQDRVMRQAAEFQNYRKRTEVEKTQMVSFGKAAVVGQLLDVVDDFERSLEAATQVAVPDGAPLAEAFGSLRDGVALIYDKLMAELAKVGVMPIQAVGQPFSEDEHEALMQQPAPEGTAAGTVLAEIQKGYRLDERVIRHARVVVAA